MSPEEKSLLDREVRAALPLRRQVLLYLDPFALFQDASQGTMAVRRRALSYNRTMRWMLVPYLRRWLFIAAVLFLAVAPAESIAGEDPLSIVPAAAVALGFCIAASVAACIAAAYLLLGASPSS